MGRRKTLTNTGVADLKPRAERYAHPDPELPGLYIRVQPSGAKSFVAVARNPLKKQIWATIGPTSHLDIDEARDQAKVVIKGISAGESWAPAQSFKAVAEQWLQRHVKKNKLRTQAEIERCLDRYILPTWAARDFTSIRRGDVVTLLDTIEDKHGPRQADVVLTIVRAIANWFATRNENYLSPVVRGMNRDDPKSRKRARILDDGEIRTIWRTAEGTFGAIVKVGLITAQRREKLATMRWEDVSVDGEWRIPTEDREKGTAGTLVLPPLALEIIRAQPRFSGNQFVFAGRGDGHFNGFSPCKRALDAKAKIEAWVIHDLRRTARSLMSRAGVRPDVAERVMGHAITGIEGIYDRYTYREEKSDALKRLADLIEKIINPPVGNIVGFRATQ